jgi:hypothetical protein
MSVRICRRRGVTLIRTELQRLQEHRSRIVAAIRELELRQQPSSAKAEPRDTGQQLGHFDKPL